MTLRFFYLFLFVIQLSQAQNFTLTQGKEFSDPDHQLEAIFIGANETHNYLLRQNVSKLRSFRLCSFDNKTSALVNETNIELEDNETLVNQAYVNNCVLLFTKIQKTSSPKIFFLLRVLNAATGDKLMETLVVEELELSKDDFNPIDLIVEFSPDFKNMLLILNNRNENSTKINSKLYNTSTFKKIWEKQFVENFEKAKALPFDCHVDNMGNFIYQIGYLLPGTEDEFAYAVCISPPNNVSRNFIKLPFENKTLINSNLELIGNELICLGEFVDGAKEKTSNAEGSALGFFLFNLDLVNLQITLQRFDYISAELAEKIVDAKPNFKHYRSYYINKELYVVNHHSYENYYSLYNTYSRYPLEFDKEILVLNYGEDRKLKWMRIIPRNVASIANVLQVVCTKNIHILYHDTPKNLKNYPNVNDYNIEKWKLTGGLGKGALTLCVTIDEKGVMKRNIVQPAEANTHLMGFGPYCIKPNSALPLKFNYNKKENIARMDLLTITD
jgi:hypothetical protein